MTRAEPKADAGPTNPNESRNAAYLPPAHPRALYLGDALTPDLLALVHAAAAGGAQITIVTVHRQPERHQPDADPRSLTTEEAAAHYRVEPATIRAWCREGRFPGATRTGKSWRIPAPAGTRRPPAPPTPSGPSGPHESGPHAHGALDKAQADPAGDPGDGQAPAPPPRAHRIRRDTPRPANPKPKHPAFDPADLGAWRTDQ